MRPKLELVLLLAVCASVLAGYGWISASAIPQNGVSSADNQHYNLLVAGFREGHLSLKKDPAPELASLPDPYDPGQNAPYRFHDASYYRGKYYLYFGVTPALLLFWPYTVLTGHALFHRQAVTIFCSAGFLLGALLLGRIRRRYFPEIGAGVMAAGVLALGAANGVPLLLRRPEVYEVAIACAYALVMAALASLWEALHDDRRRLAWTAAASVFYCLALGARPVFLFGAPVLLIPLAADLAGPESRQGGRGGRLGLALAALLPLALIGAGLAAYNALRFGSPLEFGQRYQLASDRLSDFTLFSWRYLWFNLRVYFLLPTRLMSYFPFVLGIGVPALPAGHWLVENPFGILPNLPFVFLAAAAPLACLRRTSAEASRLRWFLRAAAWIVLTSAVVLCCYVVAAVRYEVDFLPYLVLLAVIGIFGLERSLAGRRRLRLAARLGWGVLLGTSVAFNFFASCQHLNIMAYENQNDFRALSRIFDYPVYAYRRLATGNPGVGNPAFGPVRIRFDLPPAAAGGREPLLVCGGTGAFDSACLVYLRLLPGDQACFGFQYWGYRYAECSPFHLEGKGPVELVVDLPALWPALGDRRWGSVPYDQQMLRLSQYEIDVNGSVLIRLQGVIDRPILADAPVFVGSNPLGGSLVAERFTGRIREISRLGVNAR